MERRRFGKSWNWWTILPYSKIKEEADVDSEQEFLGEGRFAGIRVGDDGEGAADG
jgi:hypothetical protein